MKSLHAPLSRVDYSAFGFRFGYWPCLQAPFFEVSFSVWRWQIWYGLESYKNKKQSLGDGGKGDE